MEGNLVALFKCILLFMFPQMENKSLFLRITALQLEIPVHIKHLSTWVVVVGGISDALRSNSMFLAVVPGSSHPAGPASVPRGLHLHCSLTGSKLLHQCVYAFRVLLLPSATPWTLCLLPCIFKVFSSPQFQKEYKEGKKVSTQIHSSRYNHFLHTTEYANSLSWAH